MLRHLYRCALRLHPPEFRRHFGEEMLSIYDHSTERLLSLGLLLDAIVSLGRQRIWRSEFWLQTSRSSMPQPAANAIPSFSSLAPFRPHTSAMIHGMVISITLFCVTCFAIRDSWIHILRVQIPAVSYDSDLSIHPGASLSAARGKPTSAMPDGKTKSDSGSNLIPEPLPVDVLPADAQASTLAAANRKSNTPAEPLAAAVATLQLRLDSYVGTSVSHKPNTKIAVGIEGDHLTIRLVGWPKRALSPVSETTFLVAGTNDQWVEFVPDSNGKMRQLSLFQNGDSITAVHQ